MKKLYGILLGFAILFGCSPPIDEIIINEPLSVIECSDNQITLANNDKTSKLIVEYDNNGWESLYVVECTTTACKVTYETTDKSIVNQIVEKYKLEQYKQ